MRWCILALGVALIAAFIRLHFGLRVLKALPHIIWPWEKRGVFAKITRNGAPVFVKGTSEDVQFMWQALTAVMIIQKMITANEAKNMLDDLDGNIDVEGVDLNGKP